MKKLENTKLPKYPDFTYNPSLDARKNTPMFTEKVNAAIEIFNKFGEPSDSDWEKAKLVSESENLKINVKTTPSTTTKPRKSIRKPRKQKPQTAKI
jgi:hypothetical protein